MSGLTAADGIRGQKLQPIGRLELGVRVLFLSVITLTVAMAAYNFVLLDFLDDIRHAGFVTPAERAILVERADEIDANTITLSGVRIALFIAAAIVFLVWLYRAVKNLEVGDVRGRRYTPGWAVGWWFIPFANLVQPVRAMAELNWGTAQLARKDRPVETGMIGWWWGLWLGSLVLGRVAERLAESGSIDDVVAASWTDMVSNLGFGAAGGLAIAMVRRISKLQDGVAEGRPDDGTDQAGAAPA